MDEVELLIKKAELKLISAKILFDNGLYEDVISRVIIVCITLQKQF